MKISDENFSQKVNELQSLNHSRCRLLEVKKRLEGKSYKEQRIFLEFCGTKESIDFDRAILFISDWLVDIEKQINDIIQPELPFDK